MRFNTIARQIESLGGEAAIDALVVSLAHPLIFPDGISMMKDASLMTGIPLYCGIGGCEALRDMYDAKNVGVDAIIAPMIDSVYALEKYAEAVETVCGADRKRNLQVFATLSTIDAIGITGLIAGSAARLDIDGFMIDIDECASSAGGWNSRVSENIVAALDEIVKNGISCCLAFSRNYDGIGALMKHSAVDTAASGVLRVRGDAFGGDHMKLLDCAKRVTSDFHSECLRRMNNPFLESDRGGNDPEALND